MPDELCPSAGARLTIDLGALRANYRLMVDRVAPATVAGVVKADAYGLGARQVAACLIDAGCRHLFVAHLDEALALKPILAADATVFILNGLQPGCEARCAEAGVVPVINSLEQAARWGELAAARGVVLPAAVQIDSGMARLGLSVADVAQLAGDTGFWRWIALRLVMSHLACSDDPGAASNREQARCFNRLAAQLPSAPRSLANSGGAFLDAGYHLDLVRAGVGLYGVSPQLGLANPMRPVVRLDARVIQVRDLPAGAGVGYGLTGRRDTAARIATLAVGYGDGWPRNLGNRGAAWRGGVRLPIAGRISMDSMTLDVTALPPGALRLGDEVELLGPHQSPADVAAAAGTIPYEILTSLGPRYSRTYLAPSPIPRPVSARP